MTDKITEMNSEKLPIKTKLAYGVSDLGITLPLSAITFVLLYFYTNVVGLSPVLAGLALLIPKGWDAISDPLMGQITDRTKSRWGRRRPYLLFGAVPYAIFFIFLFSPPMRASENVIFTYLLIFFTLFFTASTVLYVPYNALLPELSLDHHERTKLIGFRQPFSILGWVTGSALILPIVGLFSTEAAGFYFTAVIFGAIAIAVFYTTFLSVREREDFTRMEALPILESFKLTLKNRLFWLFIVAYCFISIGFTTFSATVIYYAEYWLGNKELFTIIMGLVMGCILVSIPLWVFLSGKFGKKESFVAGTLILIVAMIFLLFYPRGVGPGLFAIFAVAGIGTGAYFIFPFAIMPEIIDVDEVRSGTRREGAYYGIFFLISKLAVAISPMVVGIVLEMTGYDAELTLQSESALTGIRLLASIIPFFFFAAGFIFLLFFPMGKKVYEELKKQQDKLIKG